MLPILLTGMSGVGKSTVLAELAARGFDTVDTDDGDWVHAVDGERLWREPLIDALLSRPRTGPLFIQGTVANQGRFYARFGAVVLLSAPVGIILERLKTRTTNAFGKTADERARVLRDITEIEPLLRRGATHELDATRPVSEVADSLLAIATFSSVRRCFSSGVETFSSGKERCSSFPATFSSISVAGTSVIGTFSGSPPGLMEARTRPAMRDAA
jgi:shikimate kinase